MLNTLLAALLVFLSVSLLLYVFRLLFNAASFPVGAWFERYRFGRHVARARRCDALVQQGQTDLALRYLRDAFYLHPVSDRSLAMSVANHHTGLLSRLISITSDLHNGSVRLLSLAKTDRLLTERSELQRRFLAARQSRRKPTLRELRTQLRANSRDLVAALEQLVAEARAVRQTARYH
jgi:hypothetical protein